MNCLLIDDDLDDQEIFVLAMRDANPAVECMIAKDGREGLEKIKLLNGEVHDFIFVDLNMPRMNGIETLDEIRKMKFNRRPRIIVYSTSSDEKLINDVLSHGADDFLIKPTRVATLVEKLKLIFEP
jgi:CheY-like chemotaxis protein